MTGFLLNGNELQKKLLLTPIIFIPYSLNYNNPHSMAENPRFSENEDLQELLSVYERLRSGRGTGFLSEESFERIIDHFDDQNSLAKAMEAADSNASKTISRSEFARFVHTIKIERPIPRSYVMARKRRNHIIVVDDLVNVVATKS